MSVGGHEAASQSVSSGHEGWFSLLQLRHVSVIVEMLLPAIRAWAPATICFIRKTFVTTLVQPSRGTDVGIERPFLCSLLLLSSSACLSSVIVVSLFVVCIPLHLWRLTVPMHK